MLIKLIFLMDRRSRSQLRTDSQMGVVQRLVQWTNVSFPYRRNTFGGVTNFDKMYYHRTNSNADVNYMMKRLSLTRNDRRHLEVQWPDDTSNPFIVRSTKEVYAGWNKLPQHTPVNENRHHNFNNTHKRKTALLYNSKLHKTQNVKKEKKAEVS